EPPADDGRAPPLAPVEVGEAPEQMAADARAVVVGEEPVTGPEADRLGARRRHPRRDRVERLLPRGGAPLVAPAADTDERPRESPGSAHDLARGLPPHAEKAAAVRIVRVAPDRDDALTLDLDEHPAERRMTAHRTHGPRDATRGHGVTRSGRPKSAAA